MSCSFSWESRLMRRAATCSLPCSRAKSDVGGWARDTGSRKSLSLAWIPYQNRNEIKANSWGPERIFEAVIKVVFLGDITRVRYKGKLIRTRLTQFTVHTLEQANIALKVTYPTWCELFSQTRNLILKLSDDRCFRIECRSPSALWCKFNL